MRIRVGIDILLLMWKGVHGMKHKKARYHNGRETRGHSGRYIGAPVSSMPASFAFLRFSIMYCAASSREKPAVAPMSGSPSAKGLTSARGSRFARVWLTKRCVVSSRRSARHILHRGALHRGGGASSRLRSPAPACWTTRAHGRPRCRQSGACYRIFKSVLAQKVRRG